MSVAVISLLGAMLGAFSSVAAPETYSATADDFVALGDASGSAGASASGSTFALQRVDSYTAMVDTPEVLEPVIKTLELPYTVPQLAAMVSAVNPPQTVLLTVTVRGKNPEEVANIANTVAYQYGKAIERIEASGAEVSPVQVKQTQQAWVPTEPDSRHLGVQLLVGLLLGFAVGVGQAVLRDRLDTRIRTPDDVTAAGLVTAGWIPLDDDRLAARDQTSARSEGYRTLRTNLTFMNVDAPVRVIAVTSPSGGEGKTTVACNLALTIAQTGHSVCLVEADLRQPAAAERFRLAPTTGITDVLVGRTALGDTLLTPRRGLPTVLPAGPLPPNPSELLASGAFRAMIDELRTHFDYLIVDTAPLLPVTDGALVASVADAALLIGRHGSTTRDQALQAAAALEQVGTRTLGMVINAVPLDPIAGDGTYRQYAYGYEDEREVDDRPVDVRVSGLSDLFGR